MKALKEYTQEEQALIRDYADDLGRRKYGGKKHYTQIEMIEEFIPEAIRVYEEIKAVMIDVYRGSGTEN